VMEIDLEKKILIALYHRWTASLGSPEMTFRELRKEIKSSLADDKDFHKELYILKHEGWIEYKSLGSGAEGQVKLTPKGIEVAESLATGKHPGTQKSLLGTLNLENLSEMDPDCAPLIRREQLQKTIIAILDDPLKPNRIFLYGDPRVGKSTFLRHLSETVDDRYVPLVLDVKSLQESDTLDAFTYNLAKQLTLSFRAWAWPKQQPSQENPEEKSFVGRGIEAFFDHWSRIRKLAKNRQPIIMFDEIEALLEFYGGADPQILSFLFYFVCNPGNGYFILTGSERIREIDNRQFKNLIGETKNWQRLSYYDETTVTTVLGAVGKYVAYEKGAWKSILASCDGHPEIINALLNTLTVQGRREIRERDIKSILEDIIERTSNQLSEIWECLHDEERYVVWLIGQKIHVPRHESEYYFPPNGLEFSLPELAELARRLNRYSKDYSFIKSGLDYLLGRKWIELKDSDFDNGILLFKLGILPFWVHYLGIPNEVKC
jgi:hypothetical protein